MAVIAEKTRLVYKRWIDPKAAYVELRGHQAWVVNKDGTEQRADFSADVALGWVKPDGWEALSLSPDDAAFFNRHQPPQLVHPHPSRL